MPNCNEVYNDCYKDRGQSINVNGIKDWKRVCNTRKKDCENKNKAFESCCNNIEECKNLNANMAYACEQREKKPQVGVLGSAINGLGTAAGVATNVVGTAAGVATNVVGTVANGVGSTLSRIGIRGGKRTRRNKKSNKKYKKFYKKTRKYKN